MEHKYISFNKKSELWIVSAEKNGKVITEFDTKQKAIDYLKSLPMVFTYELREDLEWEKFVLPEKTPNQKAHHKTSAYVEPVVPLKKAKVKQITKPKVVKPVVIASTKAQATTTKQEAPGSSKRTPVASVAIRQNKKSSKNRIFWLVLASSMIPSVIVIIMILWFQLGW